MHFLERIKFRFEKERKPYISLHFKAFHKYYSRIIFEKCVATLNFLFGFQ